MKDIPKHTSNAWLDKHVWSKVPKELSSPSLFFSFGLIAGVLLCSLVMMFLNTL